LPRPIYHTETACPRTTGGQKQTTKLARTDILRTRQCGARSVRRGACRCRHGSYTQTEQSGNETARMV